MPKGGADCCGNCDHNKAVQEMAHPHPNKMEEFWELSFCTLRNVKIKNPFWTYCDNFNYGKKPELRNKLEKPKRWITSSGLYEGYVRIPWNGDIEPKVGVSATCSICSRIVDSGIETEYKTETLEFCSNNHYVQWWTSINNNDYFNPKDYEDPKNIYNNILDINILDRIEDKMTRGVAKKAFVISQKQNLSLDELFLKIKSSLKDADKLTEQSESVINKLEFRTKYEIKRRSRGK